MAIVRYSPNRELNSLRREMDRLFYDLMPARTYAKSVDSYAPAAEFTEADEAYHLALEVPGISVEDLDIQATAEQIAISGKRKSKHTEEEKGAVRSEFRYGSFKRVLSLPGRIDHQNVVANYEDGILNLVLPKAESEINKVIKVNVSAH